MTFRRAHIRSPLAVWSVAALVTGGIYLGDVASGTEISFSIFYLIPVALVTWQLGRWPGLFASIAAAIVWLLADRVSGHTYSTEAVEIWDTLVRLGNFAIVSILLEHVRARLHHERSVSRRDPLTNLLNRRGFHEEAVAALADSHRTNRPFTVVYLDVDDFKSVNDRFGHDAGDDVLRRVAQALRGSVRNRDFAGRLGGDEFIAFLRETDHAAARELSERLRMELERQMAGVPGAATFSVGILTFEVRPETVASVVRLVDQLMYRVKRQGKNATLVYRYVATVVDGESAAKDLVIVSRRDD